MTKSSSQLRRISVAELLAEFGCGILYSAFAESGISFSHGRREEACVYAAIEASLETRRPAVVCVTSGEAVSNAMSAIASARAEGACLLVLSACSSPEQFGRASIQGTDFDTMPADFYRAGPLFDCARLVVDPAEVPWLLNRLTVGFQDPRGFVAHLALSRRVQQARVTAAPPTSIHVCAPGPDRAAVTYSAQALDADSFAILVGFGVRHHAGAVRELVAKTGARALTTPRAKGVLEAPCVGLGGIRDYYGRERPARLLVLGSRLSEAASNWDLGLLPKHEIIQVDLDPACFGNAFDFPTFGIHSEVGLFLDALLLELASLRKAPLLHVGNL
jgi:acetolactate synthase I/II/III large subunit